MALFLWNSIQYEAIILKKLALENQLTQKIHQTQKEASPYGSYLYQTKYGCQKFKQENINHNKVETRKQINHIKSEEQTHFKHMRNI